MEKNFTEDDVKKFTDALNFIAKEARFGNSAPDIKYMIEGRNHFAVLQGMLGKIEANILEVKNIKKAKK